MTMNMEVNLEEFVLEQLYFLHLIWL